ncbi:hypothetical protein B0H19DRAFT_1366862 [Mycena capillaripes]|nr:hypothetical protein B0H19DRAFT_1366862 [Mycena capillaripes]
MTGFTFRFPVPQWTASLKRLELWNSVDCKDSGGHSFFVATVTQCLLLVHLSIDLSALSTLAHQSHMPSLQFLRISIWNEKVETVDLSPIIDIFDTPALTEFIIEGVHAWHITTLFGSEKEYRSSFPALTSLTFVDTAKLCMFRYLLGYSMSHQYLRFPALSSLSLINLCGTSQLVTYFLRPGGPLLETINLSPRESDFTAPELWTLAELNLKSEGFTEILNTYLERSGTCSISVTIYYLPEREVTYSVHAPVMQRLGQIVPHINRIWRLRMTIRTVWVAQLLDPLFEIAAPKLQVLEIINELTNHKMLGPMELFSFPVPQWTASLKPLELWNSLDSKDSSGHSFFVATITQCLSLVHLCLDLSTVTLAHQCRMPSLKFLRISVSNRLYLATILDLFDTPALSELIIEDTHAEEITSLFGSGNGYRSSFPALTSLTFVDTAKSCAYRYAFGPMSHHCLRFPALSSLSLINLCGTSELVRYFLGPGGLLLETINLSPREIDFTDVCKGLQDAEIAADMEVFDPANIYRTPSS